MSDPMSTGLNLPQGITSDLQYTNKAIAPKGRVYESVVNPSNASSFAASSMAVIELPTARSGSYLDGKSLALRFTVTFVVTGTDTDNYISISDMANSFIDSITLYAGGQVIETISNYGDIANLMMNLAMSPSQKAALGSVIGADSNGSVYGHTINISTAGTYVRTFVLPLMSFLSSTKMIDLSEILSGLRFEITWASTANSYYRWKTNIGSGSVGTNVINASPNTNYISDVGLIHSVVELDQSGVAMVNAMKSPEGTLYFGRSFRNTQYSLTAAGDQTIPGNNRLSSIVAAYARFRTKSSTTTINTRSSANPNAGYYNWRFGSVQFPQRNVNLDTNDGGYAHAYRNLIQSVNSWATPASGCALGFLPPQTVTTGVPTVASASSYYNTREGGANTLTGVLDDALGFGTFAIGQDLELFANRGDVLLSGVSTLASPFYLNLNVLTAPSATCLVDIWAHHDLIMVVRNGQVQVIV